VNQDINIKLFLELDNFADFLLDSLNVIFLRDPVAKASSEYMGDKWTIKEHEQKLSEFHTS